MKWHAKTEPEIAVNDAQILEIRLTRALPARGWDFSIDAPVKGPIAANGVLEFGGWATASRVCMTGVLLFCQGALLRSAPLTLPRPDILGGFPGAGPCGFSILLPAWELPPQFVIEVVAVFEDGELVKLASVVGRHSCLPLAPPGRLRPLLLTSLGRTGTTHMMQLLAQHPQIVADRTYPYEANAAGYWMHLLRVLTRSEAGDPIPQPFDRGNWLQPPFTGLPLVSTPSLAGYLGDSYPGLAAKFCCDASDGFYRRLAAQYGQRQPLYFCEKVLPGALSFMFRNFYPEAREIFLVRDFRDVLCSILAFNAKRGIVSFGRDSVTSDEDYVPEFRKAVQGLVDNYRGRPQGACLVRYEDLVLRPRKTLREILTFLGLDAGDAAVETMLRQASKNDPQFEKHRTTPSPRASIGRWRHDLNPALQQLARKAFDSLLPVLGYKLDRQGDLVLGQPEATEPAAIRPS